MSAVRICRVDVVLSKGERYRAELFEGGTVRLSRSLSATRQDLGEGRFVNGEILGMPGGALIDPRAYSAIEGAIEAFMEAPLF